MEESFMVFWGPPSDSWYNNTWWLLSYLYGQQMSRSQLVLNRNSMSPTYFSHPSQKNGCYSIPSLPYSHNMIMMSKAGLKCHAPSSLDVAFIVGHLQPPRTGKGSIDVDAWMHHTLVRGVLAKPLHEHMPTPAPQITIGPPYRLTLCLL